MLLTTSIILYILSCEASNLHVLMPGGDQAVLLALLICPNQLHSCLKRSKSQKQIAKFLRTLAKGRPPLHQKVVPIARSRKKHTHTRGDNGGEQRVLWMHRHVSVCVHYIYIYTRSFDSFATLYNKVHCGGLACRPKVEEKNKLAAFSQLHQPHPVVIQVTKGTYVRRLTTNWGPCCILIMSETATSVASSNNLSWHGVGRCDIVIQNAITSWHCCDVLLEPTRL